MPLVEQLSWSRPTPGASTCLQENGQPLDESLQLRLVLGSLQAGTRQLRLCMVIHASSNLAAVALIYWSSDERIADLFHSR